MAAEAERSVSFQQTEVATRPPGTLTQLCVNQIDSFYLEVQHVSTS